MNLGRYVSRSATFYPEQNATIFEGRQITYRELDRRTNCLAQGFYAQGLKKGHAATEEEIMGHCRESLSAYKKPQSVDFVTELPKNPNGKIARRSVRERFWAGKERRVN